MGLVGLVPATVLVCGFVLLLPAWGFALVLDAAANRPSYKSPPLPIG